MSDARSRWANLRQELDEAASGTKDAQSVVLELSRHYAALAADEKRAVDDLLGDWVLSDDPKLRFDALAVISDNNVRAVVPSLRQLADRLEDAAEPSAPYEWLKVNRLLGRLADESGS